MKKTVCALFLLSALAGYSQQKISLADAVNIALKNSFDIQLAKNNVEISVINNHQGIAGGLPVVNGTASDNEQITSINQKFADPTRDTKRDNVFSNNLSVGVTGSILLYNGSRVIATKKRLEELEQLNKQVLDAQIQNTMAAVMTKYYDVVRQQSLLKSVLQSIDVSRKRLEILQVRREVGLSNIADLYQAQLDLNGLLQTQQTSELIIEQAKIDLLNLIFMKTDTKIIISDTIIVDKKIVLDTIKSRLALNPLLMAADKQVKINSFIEKEVAAQRYPSLRASTGYNLTSSKSAAGFSQLNQSYGPFVGLSLAVPIYNGSINKRQQQIASINTKNAGIQRDNLLHDYETGVMRTYELYNNTLEQLKTEIQNYHLSIQLVTLILEKFQVGQATIIDVKQAQQSFENESYRIANLNYGAKLAEIELKRLASQLAL
jgi:outer membrane protein TolC